MIQETKFFNKAIILSVSIMIVKVLGLVFVVPFSNLVGSEGVALYTYIYIPFTLFIELSTVGIPSALAKLVSKYDAKDNFKNSFKLFKIAIVIMIILGIISFLILTSLSDYYANLVLAGKTNLTNSKENISKLIDLVAISLFILPVMSVIRGFFQGKHNIYPTSISQVVEQVVRISLTLVIGYLLVTKYHKSYLEVVEVAIISTIISNFIGLLVLIYFYFKNISKIKAEIDTLDNSEIESKKMLLKQLVSISIPFALYGINYTIYQMIDSLTINKELIEYGISNPEAIYGIYSYQVQKIIFIPISLIVAFTTTMIPAISRDFALKNYSAVDKNIIKIVQIAFYFLIPISIFTFIFSQELYFLLYGNKLGGNILASYSPLIIIIGITGISLAILNTMEKHKILIYIISIGIVIKLILNNTLVSVIGIDGAIFSTSLAFLTILLINTIVIIKNTNFKINYLLKRIILTLIISFIMGSILSLLGKFISMFISLDNKIIVFLYLTTLTIIGLSFYYFVSKFLGLNKIIFGNDKKNEKICKINQQID